MTRSLDARVEPQLLAWARKTAGYGHDEVARRLSVAPSRVAEWEAGEGTPTVARLRKLASMYKRPLAAFFLPEPPVEPAYPRDFRSIDVDSDLEFPPALILAIRKARIASQVASELTHTLRDEIPGNDVPSLSAATIPEDAARQLRIDLGVSVETQVEWQSSRAAYDQWSRALERRRVLVFQMRDVEMATARAFSIRSSPFSAIVVNSKDSWNGKIFSVFHEYAHLALRESGVCDLRETVLQGFPPKPLEVYCNHVAAAFLLPSQDLIATNEIQRSITEGRWTEEDVVSIARRFHVSYEAVLRRMTTLDIVSLNTYNMIRSRLMQKYMREEKPKGKRGPSPPVRAVLDNGLYFTSLVLEGISSERVPLSAMRDYLGAYPKHFEEIDRLMRAKAG